MLKYLRLPLALLLVLHTVLGGAQPQPSTPEELGAMFHKSCMEQAPRMVAEFSKFKSLADSFDIPAYCSCIGDELRTRSTVELIRRGTREQGEKLVLDAIGVCVERPVRRVLSAEGCPAFLHGVARDQGGLPVNEAMTAIVCPCMVQAVEGLHGMELVSALGEVARISDEKTTQDGRSSSPPSRLVVEMRACVANASAPRPGRPGP